MMAIFPVLDLEDVIQVDDKTRLDARKSFVSKDEAAITLVEIEPEAGDGFIDVTGTSSKNYFLDWQYGGITRTVTASIRITTDGVPTTFTKTIEVITAADDKLYSGDTDIFAEKPMLRDAVGRFIADGRNSFLNIHRQAKRHILESINERGIRATDGGRITDVHIIDSADIKSWSRDLTISLIYRGLSNQVADEFDEVSINYLQRAKVHMNKSFLSLDKDEDGVAAGSESVENWSGRLVRV